MKLTLTLLALIATLLQTGSACTGILLKADDGAVVPARTMEFGFDVRSELLIIPKGTPLEFLSSVEGKTGLQMEAKYGFLGMNAVGKQIVLDGLNEEGLYLGAFYFNNLATYEPLTSENQSRAVSSEEFGNYVLGSFATVEEVIAGLDDITVVGSFIEAIGKDAPLHYTVADKSGRSIIIEYTDAGMRIFENTVGVVANNPTYDWHLTNLRNYLNLSPDNAEGFSINGEDYTPFGEGTGMLGLPGDFTSPTRFVRAVAFVNTSLPNSDADEAVFRAFHILNAFDIPKGLIRAYEEDMVFTDYTVWTTAADLVNGRYFFRTYQNQSLKVLQVDELLKQAQGEVTVIPSEIPREPVRVTLTQ